MNISKKILLSLSAVIFIAGMSKNPPSEEKADPNAIFTSKLNKSDPNTGEYTGPTVKLDYGGGGLEENPIDKFMYFVPLISPVTIETEKTDGNNQHAELTGYESKIDDDSFYVRCGFEMKGKGSFYNYFTPRGVIKQGTRNFKDKNKPLENVIRYIRFDDDGFGSVDVRGKISGNVGIVTQVTVNFNERNTPSPVKVGLYSVKPEDGEYKYENRYNEIVARINALKFQRTRNTPKMAIDVAAIGDEKSTSGFWASLKGAIANMFIKPLDIEPLGNDTMLDFGLALFRQEPYFTFPKAENLKASDPLNKTVSKAETETAEDKTQKDGS